MSRSALRKAFTIGFLLATLALAAPTAPDALAAQREVGPGQTYTTIQACVNAASAGDICNVHEATYTEAVTISKDITVQANAGDTPTIDVTGPNLLTGVSISANGATLDGLEVIGFGSRTGGRAGVLVSNNVTGVSILNVKAHDGYGNAFRANGGNSQLLIQNCEAYNTFPGSGAGVAADGMEILFATSSDSTFANGEIVQNCLIHNNQEDGIKASGSYITFKGNHIYDNIIGFLSANHPDGIQMLGNGQWDHLRITNNIITNHSQNIFLECNTDQPCEDIEIYGNVIYNSAGVVDGVDMDQAPGFQGLFVPGGVACKDVKVYNNTFGRHSGAAVLWFDGCSTGVSEFKNNIIHNTFGNGMAAGTVIGCPSWGSGEMDYNQWYLPTPPLFMIGCSANGFYKTLAQFQAATTGLERHGSASTPSFVNEGSGNFRLASENFGSIKAPGLPLPAPYNRDPAGNTRGADGVWDRGAFEFVVPSRPNPPQNLRSVVQ